NAFLGTQSHELNRNDLLMRLQQELPVLGDCRDDQTSFHRRKTIADADAWAAAERQIVVARNPRLPARCETFGIKALRIVKEPRVAVERIGAYGDKASSGYFISSNKDVFDRLSCKSRCRRIQAKGFTDHHFGVRQYLQNR